jgi:4-amino-4-deoxy-L-arabinose transferase-like glycosyltransferase
VVGVASLAIPTYRRRLLRDWRLWGAAKLLALVLIAPWFAYGAYRFGAGFWGTIFGIHVYERLIGATGLDPTHVHPWNFYFTQLYDNLGRYDTWPLALAGGILLVVETIRRRWREGVVLLLWFALPLGVISIGTSKLYHYVYPFLPPLALAGGYLLAFLWLHLHPLVRRLVAGIDERATTWVPRVMAAARRPVPRRLLLTIAAAAVAIVAWTMVRGPIHVRLSNGVVLKSSGFFRPWIVAVVCGILAGKSRQVGRFLGASLLVLFLSPVAEYRVMIERLAVEKHPLRTARNCLERVRSESAGATPGRAVYVAGPASAFGHGHFYYFRALSAWVPPADWVSTPTPADDTLSTYLYDPSGQRPVLLEDVLYTSFKNRLASGAVPSAPESRPEPGMVRLDDALLLLPGPYAACGARAPSRNR